MSESSSGSDDDFAAELEAQMTVADTPAKTPAPPKSAVVIAAPAAPSSRGGLDALLRGAAQKAEVRAFAAAAPPAGAAPPRRAVKRRRVPAPAGSSGAGETVSATARPDPEGGAGGTTVSSCPPHPGFLHDICVRCGTRREKQSSRGSGFGGRQGGGVPKSTSMRYIHAGLELSNDELEKAKREEKQRVLLSGKLLLVLDLDHTLLNSARFAELTQAEHDVLGRVIAARACADAGGSEAEIRKAASEAIEADPSIEPANEQVWRNGRNGRNGRNAKRERRRARERSLRG
jgi:RNA polymerase II C-terminal domain phosphatase-like 3/4